jgi:hypothetical protein
MTGRDAPVPAEEFLGRALQNRRETEKESDLGYLDADQEGDSKDCEAPTTAQMTFLIKKEVVGFHLCRAF